MSNQYQWHSHRGGKKKWLRYGVKETAWVKTVIPLNCKGGITIALSSDGVTNTLCNCLFISKKYGSKKTMGKQHRHAFLSQQSQGLLEQNVSLSFAVLCSGCEDFIFYISHF